ncbi:MAG: hypothetical protein IT539_01655 [Bradyrhizobiaceae bacterium]|nr:hypothetical protein [Bradyrhizobiaceae bacterium]
MHPATGSAVTVGHCRRLAVLAGTALLLFAGPGTAPAQVSPFTGQPSQIFSPPPPPPPPPAARPSLGGVRDPQQAIPVVASGKLALALSARYADDGPFIPRGIQWRVFHAKADPTGPLSLAAESGEPFPIFALAPGEYVVHAAYGLASNVQRVALHDGPRRETLIVPGGGLRLQGRVGDTAISPQRLRFEVYEGSFLQRAGSANPTGGRAERPPVVRSASAGELVLLPAGVYYVQSTYGEGNSVIQADVRIEPGRLTDATVHHRAAQVTLKLVSAPGGEAIANTQWSVLTPGGDSIKESIGAFPSVVLAEGDYVAVARHDGKTYQENFRVQSGRDREIEVLAR